MSRLRLRYFRKLFNWWINYGDGRELRGTRDLDRLCALVYGWDKDGR